MPSYFHRSETVIAAPLEKVFEFFSNAENLERLTPPSLKMEILTPLPILMHSGVLIDYRIQLIGVPFRWRTEITAWEPELRFVDIQLRGPYAKWEHEHRFAAEGDKTRMWDQVEYRVPGWFLAPIVHTLFVKGQVERIFQFRDQTIREIFPG